MNKLDLIKSAAILLWGMALSCAPLLPQPVEAQGLIIRKGPAGGGGGVPTPDILWWKMDSATAGALVGDGSNGGDDGTTDADLVGSGVGSTDSLDFVAANSDNATTDASLTYGAQILTISFWLNPDDLTGTETLLESSSDYTAGDDRFILELSGSTIRLKINDTSTANDHNESWTYTGVAGDWYHCLFVVDHSQNPNNVKFYLNGTDKGAGTETTTGDTAGTFAANVLHVGATNNTSNFYDGMMDDLRIWSGDQSAYAVDIWRDSALANIKTNLLAWYDFSDGTDSTGNGHTLSATGSPDYSTTPGSVETDASNYLSTPAGLVHSTPVYLADTNADASFVVGWRSRTASSGANVYTTPSLRNRMRYFSGGNTDYRIAGSTTVNSGASKTPNATDLVTAMTHIGSGDVSEFWTDGVSAGTDSATAYSGATGAGAIGSGSTFRFYFLGYWSRVLADYEIQALTDVSITYADLP